MTAPGDIQYARTTDGIDVAYMVFGAGPDLLIAPGFITHLDIMWDLPPYQNILTLGAQFRVVVMDKRGTGLSDRSLGFGSLHDRTEDIRAVLDAVGSEKVILYGISESGPMSCYYAANNPDRVQALILYGTFANLDLKLMKNSETARDTWCGRVLDCGEDTLLDELSSQWGKGIALQTFFTHPPDRRAAERVLARFERGGCTPQMSRDIMHANFEIDVRPFLPMISTPTLVMHCNRDPTIPVEFGRALANLIPNASYHEIDGDFHGSWRREDNEKLGQFIAPFLAGVLGEPQSLSERSGDRVLATILFTDIVSSTERAAKVGDAAWESMLESHVRIVTEAIVLAGGNVAGWTGDGHLATFDGPSQAVTAAHAVQDAALAIGVSIRAGIHTGEIERSEQRISGIGVHIAARVMSLAKSGEILASRTVRDIAVGSKIQFDDRGIHTLKGFSEPWQLFAIT